MTAALRHNELSAPWFLDGSMTGESFLTYLKMVLGPTIKPGDIVISDNLSCHKVAGVHETMHFGATLVYLPPNSHDFNPIEQAYAKLKAHLRKREARGFEASIEAVTAATNAFEPSHCTGFFRHAQYATH